MQFQHYDLGYQNGGVTVEVTLRGTEANVLLMDNDNFHYYKNSRNYKYYGGHAKSSPVHLRIPYASNWNIAIDLGGYGGRIESSIRLHP